MNHPCMKIRPTLLLFLIGIVFTSCSTTEEVYDYSPAGEEHIYYEINEEIEDDEAISAFIEPYVREMARTMDQVITVSEGSFTKDQPEGSLGNLAADIVRYRATTEMGERVHVSIMNNGGLRVPLPEGEITVGHIYELMPFENHITVLRFSGEQLRQIADELAEINGEPVSGLRIRIENGNARDVLVDSMNVDPDRYYWVATNNWMADGGGDVPTLWESEQRHDLDVLIRDAIIDYMRNRENIEPNIDRRIRN